MEETRPHWRRFHQYWEVIENAVALGHEVRFLSD